MYYLFPQETGAQSLKDAVEDAYSIAEGVPPIMAIESTDRRSVMTVIYDNPVRRALAIHLYTYWETDSEVRKDDWLSGKLSIQEIVEITITERMEKK